MRPIQFEKKILCVFLILVMLLPCIGISYADDIQVSLTAPTSSQIYMPGETVEISGTAVGLGEVSVAVRNTKNELIFADQPEVESGAFKTSFTLGQDAEEGKYTISIGGLGLSEKGTYTFTVSDNGPTVIEVNKPTAGQQFKAGDVVEISGTAQRVDSFAVCVRNNKNGRVYEAQPTVSNGNFDAKFTLPSDAIAGQYNICVTSYGLNASQNYNFTVASDSTGGDPTGSDTTNAALSISGDGVKKAVSFSLDDLKAMTQETVLYSVTSDYPENLSVIAQGVPLDELLDKAVLTGNAKTITFTGSDSYTATFTVDELMTQDRYIFPDNKHVDTLIALKRAERSKNENNMTGGDAPVLCFGQRAKTEQTLFSFVKCVKKITVSTAAPGQWAAPVAKIAAPNGNKDTAVATKGGEVKNGSKAFLFTNATDKVKIYYTTDGSTPDLDSKIFNPHGCGSLVGVYDPIIVNENTVVKAMAVGAGKEDSDVATFDFTVPGGSDIVTTVVEQQIDEKHMKKEDINLDNGRKGEKITLLPDAADDIDKGESGSRLTITSTGEVDEVQAQVPAAAVQKALGKGMMIGVDSLNGSYTLPLSSIDFNSTAAELGVKPGDLSMNIVISKVTADEKNKLTAGMAPGQQMLADPVEFSVEITAPDGKKKEFKYFGGTYIERDIPLSSNVDSNKAVGVVWNEEKGSFIPVPTRFETKNGKTYAVILSRTNSMYSVLQLSKTFADIQNNWAKGDIELLASKMLISGKSGTTYEPGSNVTRAEFAALLVRALGLGEGTLKEGQYKDVSASDWYAGSVAAASEEKIITGYEGNLFKPNSNITREEMAVMIARAVSIAGKKATLSGSEQTQLLAKLNDNTSISSWAKTDVALAVKAGIINGMPGGAFSPGTYADRAQSAAMLKRFLVYLNFINKQ